MDFHTVPTAVLGCSLTTSVVNGTVQGAVGFLATVRRLLFAVEVFCEIHESRVVRGQIIHDEITAYENRVESVRKLYDTLSYQFPLARRVYEQALQETRQIIEDLNRGPTMTACML
jgi:hypothetical protein